MGIRVLPFFGSLCTIPHNGTFIGSIVQKSILIADDNPLFRRSLRRLLESEFSCVVCEAGDGLEAIEKARQFKPDIIVLDFSMPVMNGLDAASKLRSMLPTVPIVIFTAHKDVLPVQRIRDAGATCAISKGDGIDTLLQYVGQVANAG